MIGNLVNPVVELHCKVTIGYDPTWWNKIAVPGAAQSSCAIGSSADSEMRAGVR